MALAKIALAIYQLGSQSKRKCLALFNPFFDHLRLKIYSLSLGSESIK